MLLLVPGGKPWRGQDQRSIELIVGGVSGAKEYKEQEKGRGGGRGDAERGMKEGGSQRKRKPFEKLLN